MVIEKEVKLHFWKGIHVGGIITVIIATILLFLLFILKGDTITLAALTISTTLLLLIAVTWESD